MFYKLFYPLKDIFFPFNLFRYISFRSAMSCVFAFLTFMTIAPFFLKFLKKKGWLANYNRKGCEHLFAYHKAKLGIPTGAGILINFSIILSALLWCDISNIYVWLTIFVILGLGLVGFVDDYYKCRKGKEGITKSEKFILQVIVAVGIGILLYMKKDYPNTIEFPFFKNLIFDLGFFYIFLVMLVITASSNAVNLSDGLDGLAIGCVILASFAYAVLAYVTGHIKLSNYLFISYIPGAGELTVLASAIAGAGLGFLWYNAYPAEAFMGDTGSLALGGAIGTIALIIKKELLLFLVGGIFVLEALSVILQVFSYRFCGRRIFLTAPFHHHFQLKDIAEPKLIVRIWIIAGVLAILSLLTLKLR